MLLADGVHQQHFMKTLKYFIRVGTNWSEVAIDDSTFVAFTPEIKCVKYIFEQSTSMEIVTE
ncbi:4540_t:CDS:2 [Entrophospora sp. SA101]|nr:4540_t:CDS:2 [Entrophospora sp. SA101]